jgi:hypothetical protein
MEIPMVKLSQPDPREALRNCGVHARQLNDQIAEADKQRSDAVATGDLDAVRKISRRVADLKNDLVTLAEGSALFEARVAKLDADDRIAACDAATEELKPALEEVCAAIEKLEELLLAAGAAFVEVGKTYERFEAARVSCSAALPSVPYWRASFRLDGFKSFVTEALADSSKWGFEKIGWRILEQRRLRWSALQREYAADYVANLKSAIREIEQERAEQLAEAAK